MELIIAFIVQSGVLGLAANIIVSCVKKLRDLGVKNLKGVSPRTTAAIVSLVLALITVVRGGEADINEISSYLAVIISAGGAWFVAHVLHKTNEV